VPAARTEIRALPGGIQVSMPGRRQYFGATFLLLWLGGWMYTAFSTCWPLLGMPDVSDVGGGGRSSSFPWPLAVLWAFFAPYALAMVLWYLGGRETLTLRDDRLILRRAAFGLGFSRRYRLDAIKEFRAIDMNVARWHPRDTFGWRSGHVAFDYGSNAVQVGAGINMSEAHAVVEQVLAAYPRLGLPDRRRAPS